MPWTIKQFKNQENFMDTERFGNLNTLNIIGAGGVGRELAEMLIVEKKCQDNNIVFIVDREYLDEARKRINSIVITHQKAIAFDQYIDPGFPVETVIAIGSPWERARMVERIEETAFFVYPSIVSRSAFIGYNVEFGVGLIACQNVVITTNVRIGEFCYFNYNTTIGHDCKIGDFVTVSPGARISGNVTIGNKVYIGANAVIKEGVTICDNVTIGACAFVNKDITEPGTYVGVPARSL